MFGFSFLQVGGFEKFLRASCLLGCVRRLVFLFSIRPESTIGTINGLSHKNKEKRKTMGKHNNREVTKNREVAPFSQNPNAKNNREVAPFSHQPNNREERRQTKF